MLERRKVPVNSLSRGVIFGGWTPEKTVGRPSSPPSSSTYNVAPIFRHRTYRSWSKIRGTLYADFDGDRKSAPVCSPPCMSNEATRNLDLYFTSLSLFFSLSVFRRGPLFEGNDRELKRDERGLSSWEKIP